MYSSGGRLNPLATPPHHNSRRRARRGAPARAAHFCDVGKAYDGPAPSCCFHDAVTVLVCM